MRKQLFNIIVVTIAGILIESCAASAGNNRLSSRPHAPTQVPQSGETKLGLGEDRDGILFVPSSYKPEKPMPLLVLMHGAGQRAQMMTRLFPLAEELGIIILAPDSRERTWDVIMSAFGEDVTFLDRALSYIFDRYRIDPKRIGLGGFSDGASYAFSLGLYNGDLFTHIAAFSPGFMAVSEQRGTTHIFVAHGTQDQILPFETTSKTIVPTLEEWGYDVRFRPFDGRHTMTKEVTREAFEWFVK